ncbi:MAG: Nramp family divalent metal transporter [Planctomycetes bacterium]|nr:Nramp family divalent metal transporter [Planctomycetota bacterium]
MSTPTPEAPATANASPPSLEGLNATVPVPPPDASFWQNLRAFAGPAFLVSVGYMDPGNWATDLDASAKYKYDLLWVVALASFMAIIMQVASARLGIVTGKDLAQACRDYLPEWTRWPNWIACEIAIAACDLAEVVGSALAINLLFGIPLFWAVIITAFDVLLLLALQGYGMRFIEAVIVVLVLTIGGCYFIEIFVLPHTQPDFLEMGRAMASPGFRQEGMIVLAIGIIGATVMPHNLYLHSALVQSRQLQGDDEAIQRAIRFNTIDTVAALSIAFMVNAGILVLAAMVFHGKESATLSNGDVVWFKSEAKAKHEAAAKGEPAPTNTQDDDDDADWIRWAFLTLTPLLGPAAASILFAVALLAAGQSSTVTGTLAGQVVMEGFMHWRFSPVLRRMLTRLLAIIPAVVIIGIRGDDQNTTELLTISQVVLGLQLPLAMFPLLYFTSSQKWMGEFKNGWFLLIAGWTSCLLITALDVCGVATLIAKTIGS